MVRKPTFHWSNKFSINFVTDLEKNKFIIILFLEAQEYCYIQWTPVDSLVMNSVTPMKTEAPFTLQKKMSPDRKKVGTDQIFLPSKPSVPCLHEIDPDSLFSGFGGIGA